MKYFFLGLAVIVLIALLSWYISYLRSGKGGGGRKGGKVLKQVKCPVCNSDLYVGENLISKVYRPMNVPDQLMIIMGCPHCFPSCEPGVKRNCPVCHKSMGPKDSLTARLFNKSLGKKHVHIVGCSNCHKPRAK